MHILRITDGYMHVRYLKVLLEGVLYSEIKEACLIISDTFNFWKYRLYTLVYAVQTNLMSTSIFLLDFLKTSSNG